MAPHQQVNAKPLKVKSIEQEYNGWTHVTLSAPVCGKETFYFTVPKQDMQVVVSSVEARDTRGSTLRISFPSRASTRVKPLVLNKSSAWRDLLNQHQGARVELQTDSGPVDGYFMGFQELRTKNEISGIILLRDGNVSFHQVDRVFAISFKGTEVEKRLERYTSLLSRSQEQNSIYRVEVTADAVGPGEVVIQYTVSAVISPQFDFTYSIKPEIDAAANGADGNNQKCQASGEIPKVWMKCHAVIRNPLHFDVDDAQFFLRAPIARDQYVPDAYPAASDPMGMSRRSQSSSPPCSPRRPKNHSSRSGGSPSSSHSVPKSPPRNHSTVDNSDTESDSSVDTRSDFSGSTTSLEAYCTHHSYEWKVPHKISIKEGESLKVLLYETQMDGGLVLLYSEFTGVCKRALWLHNTSDKAVNAGQGIFVSKGTSVKLPVPWIRVGRGGFVIYGRSGCAVETFKSSQRGETMSSKILNESLVAKVVCLHTTKYLFHNKEDTQRYTFLRHESKDRTGRDVRMSARLFPSASGIEQEEEEAQGTELEEYSRTTPSSKLYRFHVEATQKCLVVVHETEIKLERYEIFDCSRKEIARLEQKGLMQPVLAEKLRGLADMRREMKKLKETEGLLRRRLDSIKNHKKGLTETKASVEQTSKEDEQDKFLEAMTAIAESAVRIEKNLDQVQSDEVNLEGKMRSFKEEVCGKKTIGQSREK